MSLFRGNILTKRGTDEEVPLVSVIKTMGYFLRMQWHSVEITEIYYHTFLNQKIREIDVFTIKSTRCDLTKYFFGEREFHVFSHCA